MVLPRVKYVSDESDGNQRRCFSGARAWMVTPHVERSMLEMSDYRCWISMARCEISILRMMGRISHLERLFWRVRCSLVCISVVRTPNRGTGSGWYHCLTTLTGSHWNFDDLQ
jgi:hypothetical protein